MRARMKSGITPRSIVAVFVGVALFYFATFYGMEYLRGRKGPWELDFQPHHPGAPALVISEPALGVKDVTILFHGESATNASGVIRFDRVERAPGFGRLLFHDLTFLPGVLTFDFFGHEIELLPRVLVVNKREIPWRPGETIDLWPTNKPAQPPQPPRRRA